ncbi:MAG: RnfABCDGE type electron transport complex subunit D [Lachnospiraceae bacterium]|nr:RnfABCDGE type electron transport complex subunit D [Lachnospiraceae bacterium]
MSELFNVASSPHIRSKDTSSRIMLYVIIGLLPASCFGIYNFGIRALIMIIVSIASAVISEYIFNKIVGKEQTINDLSAVVTGLLLALNVSSTIPYWEVALGSVFAIVIVKGLFGGLGQNFMNPALGGRCFLLISFTGSMTSFIDPKSVDGLSAATPLAVIKSGEGLAAVNVMDMFIGRIGGTIGETSVVAILIGAIFLIIMGVIDITIPASYIITFVIFLVLFAGHGFDPVYITAELCGGGIMLGAFFMATDYVTGPITPTGRIVFGICLGLLTGIFRIFGASAEGVSYAIIFSNLLVPLIERVTVPLAFGVVKEKKGGDK